MKIVDVCAFYAPRGGGVRTYVERKLAAGPRFGHEIVIIAPGEEHRVEERGEGARIVYLPAPRFPLDRNYRYFDDARLLHQALDAERPDFVEASSPWRSADTVAQWQGSAPRALVMHADPLAAYAYRWFEPVASRPAIDRGFDLYWRHLRKLDQGFDAVVSASESLSGRLREGGLHGVTTQPMGVEPGIFDPALRDEQLRARLLARCGLGREGTLLVGIGRHAPEKRWPMVIDACVAASYRRPVALMLVGDGRERKKIMRHVGPNPHIQLLSPISDRPALARLMASADALIHGCEAETFCMVAAEARASGLPLIVPDRGGASDQARAAGGLLYTAADAASAAQAIGRFADVDRVALRQAGLSGARETRTMDRHFAELFALYASIATPVRRAA
ncbi:glycosyltransferase [Flavisphingomonas formosensis]|uniref:glycosyltransferase n=1 Tax=Flavisphingomonas formosensis TaxID=861534 RepID=UPI0012FC525C|nr:glycosyltransferase [Sphingomonas formosensis]